jgi:hypothetical protein
MDRYFYDAADQKLYILKADGTLRILSAVGNGGTPPPETKQRKWHKANKRGAKLQREIEQEHQSGRQPHPGKERVEKMLIAGDSVAAILEKLDMSAPTIYVIKSRLKKEGNLPF